MAQILLFGRLAFVTFVHPILEYALFDRNYVLKLVKKLYVGWVNKICFWKIMY